MTLAPGSSLSHYAIVERLGAGAMGEVWRARDTRLGREVAIKVLPEEFADDEERLRRFEREAKALATLNHPNVAQIHSVDQVGDTCFLVLELVPGESLEERLRRGPLPVEEALDVCRQIAEGLEAAHEAGVIHRDLKPANVRLTPDGRVKVLDFGLAKPMRLSEETRSTDSVLSTEGGRLLGTPTYMAPEQARGKAIDRRIDVWAFGCVLYECLTSKRAFDGETLSDVLSNVLRTEPDLRSLPPETPPSVRALLTRCLHKDSRMRLRDAGEARLVLADPGSDRAAHRTGGAPARGTSRLPWMLALAATAAAAFFALRPAREPSPPSSTAAIAPTPPALRSFVPKTFGQQLVYNARFLPDGQSLVYSAALTGNRPAIFVLQANAMAPQRIAPVGTLLLSVSKQGELAVLTDTTYLNHRVHEGTLARMTIDGSPRALIDSVRDADWGPDGELAIVRRVAGRDRLEYPPGNVLHENSGYISEPRVAADGSHVAFLDHAQWLDDRGWVKAVDRAGTVATLSDEYWALEGLAWAPGGERLHFSGADTLTTSLLPLSTALAGADVRVEFTTPGDLLVVDATEDGRLLAIRQENFYGVAARRAGESVDIDLSWLDQSWSGQLSPDGETLLFSSGAGGANYSVVTRRLDGSPISTLGEGDALSYSPDGRWVAAHLFTPSGIVLYPTGAGAPRRLERGTIENYEDAYWFPDGKNLLLTASEPGRPSRCFRQSIEGGAPEPVTPEGIVGRLSPGGDRIAAADPASGWKLYALDGGAVRDLSGLDSQDEVVSWSPDGEAVLVRRRGEVPMRVDRLEVATGKRTPSLVIGASDQAGLVRITIRAPVLDPERGYGYSYNRRLSQLFVVEPR